MNLVKKKILILPANPKSTPKLRLDEEVREINEGVQLRNITMVEFDPEAGDPGKYVPAFTILKGNTITG